MSVGEDAFFDALQDDLDLEVTGDDSMQQNIWQCWWRSFLAQGLFYGSLSKGNPGAPPERILAEKGQGCSSNMATSRLETLNWSLPQHGASYICKELGIEFLEIGFYRDVHVWFPEDHLEEGQQCTRRDTPEICFWCSSRVVLPAKARWGWRSHSQSPRNTSDQLLPWYQWCWSSP